METGWERAHWWQGRAAASQDEKRHLAKVRVAGSISLFRSILRSEAVEQVRGGFQALRCGTISAEDNNVQWWTRRLDLSILRAWARDFRIVRQHGPRSLELFRPGLQSSHRQPE